LAAARAIAGIKGRIAAILAAFLFPATFFILLPAPAPPDGGASLFLAK